MQGLKNDMKNRKLLFFLISAVVIIWGVIIYKVFSWMGDDSLEKSAPVEVVNKNISTSVKDTFSLLLNYPDPFGFHPVISREMNHSAGKAITSKKWPSISFYGTISTGNKKTTLASLRVNGNEVIMKQGDTCCGMRLVTVKKEGIVVRYHGEEREMSSETEKR
jgi:hypothetical protein